MARNVMNSRLIIDLENSTKLNVKIAGLKTIKIEKLMGHSVGISDSYYRATEDELLDDYLKAVPILTIK